jgi:hypothetical protein
MTDLTFEELVEKFNIISNALSSDEYNKPTLEISMRGSSKDTTFCADLIDVEIKNGGILKSPYGTVKTPEEAMRDYYNHIVGKRLVYRAMNKEYRRECVVVG